MITKFLVFLILGIFIVCFFDRLIGLIGLCVVFIYYCIVYLKNLRSAQSLILPLKDEIITQFDSELGQEGEKHFDYIYKNMQHYLYYESSSTFATVNFLFKLGLLTIGLVSLWNVDWISLTICIFFGLIAIIWTQKYDKHVTMRVNAKRNESDAEFKEYARVLDSYNLFFKKHFPNQYHIDS